MPVVSVCIYYCVVFVSTYAWYSVFICACKCVTMSEHISVCLTVCDYICVDYVCLCVYLGLSVCQCLCLCIVLLSVSVSLLVLVSDSMSEYLSWSLNVSMYVSVLISKQVRVAYCMWLSLWWVLLYLFAKYQPLVFNHIPGTRDQAQYVVLCVCESVSQPVTLSQYLMLLEGNEENESCAQSLETRQRVICCNIMR